MCCNNQGALDGKATSILYLKIVLHGPLIFTYSQFVQPNLERLQLFSFEILPPSRPLLCQLNFLALISLHELNFTF